ncbi:helix-turn-helix transcriptional regulator [Erysipelothrix urinaevulpis]|uniref:helix-turn-helix transcriptional regulator n=1 Tax=Erysipelothrix urinaevulpis TaxID=2683717 RepID=UPI001357E46E|nr:helix-turn-helix transcriptional regulator [Erysipelothrix urinaevulpis]
MNQVKEFRNKKGISQACLAEETNISRQTISAIENGGLPSYETMEKIATFFEVNVSEIFFTKTVNHT